MSRKNRLQRSTIPSIYEWPKTWNSLSKDQLSSMDGFHVNRALSTARVFLGIDALNILGSLSVILSLQLIRQLSITSIVFPAVILILFSANVIVLFPNYSKLRARACEIKKVRAG